MKKVLMAFDGKNFSHGVFKFANKLHNLAPIQATGVFLPVVDYTELLYSIGPISGPFYTTDLLDTDTKVVEESIEHFETLCKSSGLPYKIHQDMDRRITTELKDETRYADLLLLSSELFYENLGKNKQEEYLVNVLHKAECPAILIPEEYQFPESIVLAYDGSASSVFAIKQFVYLFPELTSLKTILVYASPENEIPNLSSIQEFLECHFSNLNFFKLNVDPKIYFDAWLTDNEKPMLVTGSFGRSLLSEFVKKSFINEIVKEHKIPVFVTHK